ARGGAAVAPAIAHQHLAGRRGLDRLPLRVLGIGEDADMVEILARRDVAEGERLADHRRFDRGQRPDALQVDVAETAFEQLRRERGRAAGLELGGDLGVEHAVSSSSWPDLIAWASAETNV